MTNSSTPERTTSPGFSRSQSASPAERRGQAAKARKAAALVGARNKAVVGILMANNLPTEQQWSDSLDFPEVAVWTLRAMLDAAYEAGRAAGLAAN